MIESAQKYIKVKCSLLQHPCFNVKPLCAGVTWRTRLSETFFHIQQRNEIFLKNGQNNSIQDYKLCTIVNYCYCT